MYWAMLQADMQDWGHIINCTNELLGTAGRAYQFLIIVDK
jgi:hypothetical protein